MVLISCRRHHHHFVTLRVAGANSAQAAAQAAPLSACFPGARDLLFVATPRELVVLDLELGLPAGGWYQTVKLYVSMPVYYSVILYVLEAHAKATHI